MNKKSNLERKISIEDHIYVIRGQRIMIGPDLARLYGVTHGALNQAVKRNRDRFPDDFVYQLAPKEVAILKSQIVISSWGGSRATPYAFTEQGVAMLSSVLRSKQAIRVNVAIMRAFVRLRGVLESQEALSRKLAELEQRVEGHDQTIRSVFEAIRELMTPPDPEPKKIGFSAREARAQYGQPKRELEPV